ncbi:hypothetical protein OG689_10475 [Kitasatospora sp. NBC_00240]|uniref:hypothetical protein n=1 Tax=Kitasatospora sp. NBC_00240 TaxID=2903567 RepID=UPI00224E88FA|nr:hypothetical protein [Kitasatospora sp. NBC_00240]MCX5209707.1 hypothetical protein [Kitasatospora sp. NBC_00240]
MIASILAVVALIAFLLLAFTRTPKAPVAPLCWCNQPCPEGSHLAPAFPRQRTASKEN